MRDRARGHSTRQHTLGNRCVLLLHARSMLAITESCVAAASLVCKSVITVAYSGGYIYTTELLPTTVRNFGLGVVSQVIPCHAAIGVVRPPAHTRTVVGADGRPWGCSCSSRVDGRPFLAFDPVLAVRRVVLLWRGFNGDSAGDAWKATT